MIDLLTRISTLYNIPQWAVNIGAITIFIILVAFPFVAKKLLEPKYRKFRQMSMYNVLWRWKYKKDEIVGLWCYCPKCLSMLSCDDENCRATEELQDKITFFVCNECGGHEQGRVVGGDRRYAVSLVKREVLREIRTGEYIATMKAFKDAQEEQKRQEIAFNAEEEKIEVMPEEEVVVAEEIISNESTEPTIIEQESLPIAEVPVEEVKTDEILEEKSNEEAVKKDGI